MKLKCDWMENSFFLVYHDIACVYNSYVSFHIETVDQIDILKQIQGIARSIVPTFNYLSIDLNIKINFYVKYERSVCIRFRERILFYTIWK